MKKHPELEEVEDAWERIEVLIDEDEDDYNQADFMLKFPNESKKRYDERKEAFTMGFINKAGQLIRAKGDSVYKKEIIRTNLTPSQEKFNQACDKSGQSFQELMHNEVAPVLAAYGTVFAVLDKTKEPLVNREQELTKGIPYITILENDQLIDFEWGDDGELLWVAYLVDAPIDRTDPAKPKNPWGTNKTGIAIWDRNQFVIKNNALNKDLQAPIPNQFGFVPVVIQAQYVKPNHTIGRSTFFSGSRYILMGNNLKAAANNEVFKGASSTLLMNIQDYGEESSGGSIEHPVNPETNLKAIHKQTHDQENIMLYVDPANKPEYLSKDLELIEIASKQSDAYFELAAENEKTSIDQQAQSLTAPESGVSKGYDFESINKMLTAFGNALNHFENQAFRMVAKMNGENPEKQNIQYPDDYDVKDYNDRVNFVKNLKAAGYTFKAGLREAYKALTSEITSSKETQEKINAEIDADPMEPPQPEPGAKPKGAV